ncbi:hypothetical protein [Desulfogranum marinum]|uniref:hypothetical protein n=1 Tax=Desulfogranum marinum TaxID=453220 RepID=UPI001962C8CB|nr:hypothetical protein [Desulfogranum marinum]MBM9515169.1 hypothetical protein [Desulfogranum marinum]
MKKNNNDIDDSDSGDYECEIIRDEVTRIFKENPHDYISELEKLGFEYCDDEIDHEELEESLATPQNTNQEYLVSYFDGKIALSDKSIAIFLEERNSATANFPLLRKYFKSANPYLLSLIIDGLERDHLSEELLSDLAFFHGFHNQLSLLIKYYSHACEQQEDLDAFSKLAMDFYDAVLPDGFNAYYALRDLFHSGTDKRKVVDFLIEVAEQAENDAKRDVYF